MLIRLDRDSVAGGDDIDSHDASRSVDGSWPLERFVAALVWDRYLPQVHGGRSCWILRTNRRGPALGVVNIRYGEFQGLRLLSDDSPMLSDIGDSLFFEYATQEDPDEVFARLEPKN